jgi:hypothetical protein
MMNVINEHLDNIVKLTFLDEQNGNISSRDIINDLSTVFESFESISKKK